MKQNKFNCAQIGLKDIIVVKLYFRNTVYFNIYPTYVLAHRLSLYVYKCKQVFCLNELKDKTIACGNTVSEMAHMPIGLNLLWIWNIPLLETQMRIKTWVVTRSPNAIHLFTFTSQFLQIWKSPVIPVRKHSFNRTYESHLFSIHIYFPQPDALKETARAPRRQEQSTAYFPVK